MVASWFTVAALACTLDVSDRTEFRLRYPGLVANMASVDLETDPDAKLTLASRSGTLLLEYAPQLVAWDMNIVGVQPAYLNRGTARGEWRWSHVQLALTEVASYGLENFGSLALTPGPNGAPASVNVFPVANTFLYEASLTTLEARWRPRRWSLTAAAAYQLAGGATVAAQETLPLQSGPLGALSADYSVTRVDHVIASMAASYATFSTGVDGGLLEVDEAWRHGLSRTTSLLLRGGASEAATRGISADDTPEPPQAPFHFETDPVAEILFRWDYASRHATGDFTASSRLGPTVNPLIGLVDEQVGGTLAGHYARGLVGLRAQATFLESVPPSRLTGVRLFFGEVAATYRLTRAVSMDLGIRTLWEEPSASGEQLATAPANAVYLPVPFRQEVGFLSVTIKADTFRF
jgi:hypothetical protein